MYVRMCCGCLFQTNSEYRERDQQIWGKVFHAIQKLLRMGAMLCVKNKQLTTKDKEKYFISGMTL